MSCGWRTEDTIHTRTGRASGIINYLLVAVINTQRALRTRVSVGSQFEGIRSAHSAREGPKSNPSVELNQEAEQ